MTSWAAWGKTDLISSDWIKKCTKSDLLSMFYLLDSLLRKLGRTIGWRQSQHYDFLWHTIKDLAGRLMPKVFVPGRHTFHWAWADQKIIGSNPGRLTYSFVDSEIALPARNRDDTWKYQSKTIKWTIKLRLWQPFNHYHEAIAHHYKIISCIGSLGLFINKCHK